jgi:large subunit ribosomal protein L19
MNVIDKIEKNQMDKISSERNIPEFGAGDTIKVDVKIIEGDKERIQAFEGLCIARSGGGLNESFTVRKISYGEGVERIFPIFSPKIAGITLLKRGKVRRAKLYYLRDRRGKSARIVEKIQVSKKDNKPKVQQPEVKEASEEANS